ncbi:MAG: 2,3-bisphosphoglycerate-independent phosphoglycerate mutase [bacterium]|nr:2,3-bisphosphoglycerate-independent phosphoglycerate mutase [bacterium]
MRKLALIILDGWGLGEEKENNAIHMAKTPFFDSLWKQFPHTTLQASGEYVGLPEGQIGGSEVGHLTIGAGRVIFQELQKINRSLTQLEGEHSILNQPQFKLFIELARKQSPHLVGLVSTGGVHSHQDHLFHLLKIMKKERCKEPFIHFISDGRDTSPTSSLKSSQKLLNVIHDLKYGKVVTLVGRFYAMDRDHNMDRTKKALDLFMSGKDDSSLISTWETNLIEDIKKSHANKITDEFIEPVLIDSHFKGIPPMSPVLFFNFRSDRMKQIVTEISHTHPHRHIFTLTKYDKSYPFPAIFQKEKIDNTLGEILSKHGLSQLRVTETEKAPHVTYFFNGGVEITFPSEERTIAESHKVKHDEIPEMRATEIAENITRTIGEKAHDFILVNFANPDMVGHTGNFDAVVKGVERVDQELKKIVEFLSGNGYICLITADHGNADIMYDLVTHEPHTAHTLNPVPFIIYDTKNKENQKLKLDQNPANGLSLIAGTVMKLMELPSKDIGFKDLIR